MMRCRAGLITILAVLISLAVPACSIDPTKLPVPGSYLPNHPYRIEIELTSALNVPGKARVDSDGVQIGVLDHVDLVGTTAVAHVDIDGDTLLPKNTRAELRQATVLGDIYIAMIPPSAPSRDWLRNGDSIKVVNTVPSSNVEDLLRSMSNLINGGALVTLQDTINNINASVPPPDLLMQIHHRITGMLRDMGTNKVTLDKIITSLDDITKTLKENAQVYSRLVHEGPEKLTSLAGVAYVTADLIIQGGDLGRSLSPIINPITPDLIQLLSYLTPFVHTVSTADTTIPVVSNKLVRLIRERLIPFFKNGGPKYTVTDINNPYGSLGVSPAERADEVIQSMQTMGLIR